MSKKNRYFIKQARSFVFEKWMGWGLTHTKKNTDK